MATSIDFDLSQYRDFFQQMSKAGDVDFKRELGLFLEGLGNEFLRVLEEEIIRREVMDKRLLLHSFQRGDENGVWQMDVEGLTLEVGTAVNYASYVNDGHWTNPKGVDARWVPGHWEGDRFTYDPSSDEGMLLKQHWVQGAHFWESALRIVERVFPGLLERKLQAWIDRYFGG